MRKSETRSKLQEIRQTCEADLFKFAKLVNPRYVYGDIHQRVFKWLQDEEDGLYQLLLLPRGHLKSHCLGVWVAWWVTKHPETTILYLSATTELAEKQLYDIKNMLTHSDYSRLWPEMVHPDEGKREKWSTTKIAVDHPMRKTEGIRDWTISAAGLTTNTTGWHADIIIPDDVVVPDNAYTEDGRRKVASCMGQMNSILNAGGMIKGCGTRYHPQDYYKTIMDSEEAIWDEETDEIVEYRKVWDVMEEVVEIDGVFLWPRKASGITGKMYGFNRQVLERIKQGYEGDPAQFYAQYYNDPNDSSTDRIDRDNFQYFEPGFLKQEYGQWYYGRIPKPLNIYAAVDFAFSESKTADYTAVVVIGLDADGNYYVLDIDRFKTSKISVIFDHILALHSKWGFKSLRAEVSVAQGMIVNDLRDYIKREGMMLKILEHRPTRNEGTKQERISAALDHRYEQKAIWHYNGGYTSFLEEELVLRNPAHDDIKDALACAVEIAVKPFNQRDSGHSKPKVVYGRFGGVAGTRR